MPIYTYKCDTCGYQWDDLEPMNSIPEKPCQNIIHTKSRPDASCQGMASIPCKGTGIKIPSVPAPARFNCSMPTPQKPREIE